MNDIDQANADVRRTVDREVALVDSAIDLVASGGARSTMVIGLQLTEAVIAIVEPHAVRADVAIEPIWGPDEETGDVRVTRLAPV